MTWSHVASERAPARQALFAVTLSAACLLACTASAQPVVDGCAKAPASPLVVNVRDKGVRGDGRTDDTEAFQAAINEVAGTGGTLFVPDGTYMLDATRQPRLSLGRDMTLRLSPGATLKVIPNSATHHDLLTISGVSNVIVEGGTLEGDRERHLEKRGESGYGIHIRDGAAHVTIRSVTSKKMWGDGFFVDNAKDVSFCGVTADYNRRQGLSVIEADGLLVANSVFSNTRGTAPMAGIDLEPNLDEELIKNVRIVSSKFLNNRGAGVLIAGRKGTRNISDVEISRNLFTGVLPIKIKYAPGVLDTAICRNRQIAPRTEPTGGLSAFAEPAEQVVLQSECGDPRLQIRR
ncbi:MAG: right-handed parallel beta-helix repeat-containing protein [Hyphomicrobium sp.]|uniref:right-handed parallel beta-helix repeat-containing protein n=1 Tax=Hyphomicrobium sp. TaxID=82 RepID=UPI0013220406|nr:right-handed parallel beta-helix repeat-containing protein [Hyphomicrobium sp.]KAB2941435.1 MAG: hypothetical protein F9K20_10080 [Hyphomicrobium sp.]MBZ0212093.1 right-handed parallel beta-helix repeat-containing protein [Hyphomicrobium sp.]